MSDEAIMVDSHTVANVPPAAEPAPQGIQVGMTMKTIGPCRRHVTVTIPRADIDRVYDDCATKFETQAVVPGFRNGRAPRELVQKRFRKELSDEVRQRLLMMSLETLSVEGRLDAINEPDIDLDSIEIPETGDLVYDFEVEVRPEFDLPDYKGLALTREVRNITDEDVKEYVSGYLESMSPLSPKDESGTVELRDFITADVTVTLNDKLVGEHEQVHVRVLPSVKFGDAEISGFDNLLVGAKIGDVREFDVTISPEASRVLVRGEKVHVKLEVTNITTVQPMSLDLYTSLAGFDSTDELYARIRSILERQTQLSARQSTRAQILSKITESANWELPESLVLRQVENALSRDIIEMQEAGHTDDEIEAHKSDMMRNQLSRTRQALKEHFVLDKIAKVEKITVLPEDIEEEIDRIAEQQNSNPRKVRARLEKSGMIENLGAQIIEQKAVNLVLTTATVTDVPAKPALDLSKTFSISTELCNSSHLETSKAASEEA